MTEARTIGSEDDLYGLVLGTILAQRRERALLTQRDISVRVGVSTSIVSRWEQGLAIPRQHHFRGYADAVGSSQSKIIKDVELVMTRASHIFSVVRSPPPTNAKTPWWSEAVAAFGQIGLLGFVLIAAGETLSGRASDAEDRTIVAMST